MRSVIKNTIISVLPIAILLLLWEYIVAASQRGRFLFGSPSLVFRSLIENIGNGTLVTDVLVTSGEALLGFVQGNLLGTVVGISLWFSRRTAQIAQPYIVAIGAVPIFAVAPMMIVWFGTGFYSKVMMATISTVTIAITQSYEGARNVDVQQVRLFKSLGASNRQLFTKLLIPSSLIWVFNSLRLNITFALLGAFIGEFISASSGLGFRIVKAAGLYDTALVISSILCIILIAFVFLSVIYGAERFLMPWKKPIN